MGAYAAPALPHPTTYSAQLPAAQESAPSSASGQAPYGTYVAPPTLASAPTSSSLPPPAYAYVPPSAPRQSVLSSPSTSVEQTQAPQSAAPAAPAAPSYDAEPCIEALTLLSAKCGACNLPPLEVRKLEDVNKRLGLLFEKLRSGAVS